MTSFLDAERQRAKPKMKMPGAVHVARARPRAKMPIRARREGVSIWNPAQAGSRRMARARARARRRLQKKKSAPSSKEEKKLSRRLR